MTDRKTTPCPPMITGDNPHASGFGESVSGEWRLTFVHYRELAGDFLELAQKDSGISIEDAVDYVATLRNCPKLRGDLLTWAIADVAFERVRSR